MVLCGPDADRKFLQDIHVPRDEAKQFGLGCSHTGCIDKPITNMTVINPNIARLAEHEQQKTADNTIWNGGGMVYNKYVSVMAKNRQQPFKPEVARQTCYCGQSGCTSKNWAVPIAECHTICIDTDNGCRYGFDEHGNCLCPICWCSCRLA